jgi:predicted permease
VKFREAWRLSRIVAIESILKGQLLMTGGYTSLAMQKDPIRFVKRAKQSFTLNKIFFALVYGVLSFTAPLVMLGPGASPQTEFVVNSIFLLFGLVFLVTFNLLNVTSFVSGEALKPVAAMPFSRDDLSRISVLSFLRMLDLPLIVFVLGYPIMYGLITGSVIGAVAIFLVNFANAIIAVFATFFLARGFYRRILSVGGSRVKSFVRTILTLLFGFITIGMSYLVFYVIQAATQLVAFFAFVQSPQYSWITLIYPFSFGYVATLAASTLTGSISQLSLTSLRSIMAICATFLYAVLGYLAYRRGTGALRQLALGEIEMGPKMRKVGEIKLQVGGVYSSVIRKDLRLASRNPAYAGFLVMPILGVIIFTVIAASYAAIRVVFVLSALAYSSFLMVAFALSTMWFETRGVSVLAELPISTRRVVQAKSVTAGALSLMIPSALFIISLFKPLTTPYSLLIALVETLGIYSSALLGTTLVCSLFGEGRLPAASFQGHLLKYGFTMIISNIFMAVPLLVYGLAYLLVGQDHFVSLVIMTAATVFEVIIVNAIARGALKD